MRSNKMRKTNNYVKKSNYFLVTCEEIFFLKLKESEQGKWRHEKILNTQESMNYVLQKGVEEKKKEIERNVLSLQRKKKKISTKRKKKQQKLA